MRPDDGAALAPDIVALAVQYGRYRYRRIAPLLRLPACLAGTFSPSRRQIRSTRFRFTLLLIDQNVRDSRSGAM